MKVPTRAEYTELIRLNRQQLDSLESSLFEVRNLAYLENEIRCEAEDFELISERLLSLLDEGFVACEYLCPCGSELLADRERDEEQACSKCYPRNEEVEYERDI